MNNIEESDAAYRPVAWTPEKIARFWNFFARQGREHAVCFSQDMAGPIYRLVRNHLPRNGLCVDLGCGPGFFLEELLRRGHRCKGVDPSPESVAEADKRLSASPRFAGVETGFLTALPCADGEAEAALLLEVLEHLLPDDIDAAWSEIARVVRPGGVLIVSVPNAEDLDARAIACPECGCVFHRVQHLRRFTAASLGEELSQHGFAPHWIRDFNLAAYAGGFLRRLLQPVRPLLFGPGPRPNLLAAAVRA